MDLAIAAYVLTFCAAVSFRVCKRYSHGHSVWSQIGIVGCLVLSVWISWCSTYSLRWAQILPHGSVLFFANASLLLVIVAAGLIFGEERIGENRKNALACILTFTAAVGIGSVLFRPLVQPLQLAQDSVWKDGVCLQTNEASCAPAAAATLLGMHGVQTDERQMAISCLTSRNGTYSLAAFRGIQNVSKGVGIGTRALVCEPLSVPSHNIDDRLPMLALVDYGDQLATARQGRSQRPFGSSATRLPTLKPGDDRHAVVLMERLENGQYLVADPAIGKVRWCEQYFRNIWVGEGIYLVSK